MSIIDIKTIEQFWKEHWMEWFSPKLIKIIDENKDLINQKINFVDNIGEIIEKIQLDLEINEIDFKEIDNYLLLIAKNNNIDLWKIFEFESVKKIIETIYKEYNNEGIHFYKNKDNYEKENKWEINIYFHWEWALSKAIYKHQKLEDLIGILKNRYSKK